MSSIAVECIAAATLRANPGYELVFWEDISSEEQNGISVLQDTQDVYGLLRPRAPAALSWKSICRDTADLYRSLEVPGPLPTSLRYSGAAQNIEAVAALVLDGVLELAHEDTFVSGMEAYPLLYGQEFPTVADNHIARLSLEALQYAQTLDIDDPIRLAMRLYFYNAYPLSPYWQRRFATPEAINAHLGIQPGTSLAAALSRNWTRARPKPPNDGWLFWQSRHVVPPGPADTTYKLYISPHCDWLPEALQAAAGILTETQAHTFKVGGKDVANILRSDKLIGYFQNFEALLDAADRLQQRLAGCKAHGVPFTAALTPDGLLSWGMDPPSSLRLLLWNERQSWRLWVTYQLATALMAARPTLTNRVQPWQYALHRLAMENVDTQTWTPAKTLWQVERVGGMPTGEEQS